MPSLTQFGVYEDLTLLNEVGLYNSLAEALLALGDNMTLTLPEGFLPAAPVPIAADNVFLWPQSEGISVALAPSTSLITVVGREGATIFTSSADTRVNGNFGTEVIVGNDGNDYIFGSGGSDIVAGGGGDDLLWGGQDADVIISGDGEDKLFGGDGSDTLIADDGALNRLTGGDGADRFAISLSDSTNNIVFDFEPLNEGDHLYLFGDANITDWDSFLANATIEQSGTKTMVYTDNIQIQFKDMDVAELTSDVVTVIGPDALLEFSSIDAFLATGLQAFVSEVSIDGVTYKARSEEPLHEDFKQIDAAGTWWSPDYFVIVAAGQSNMLGGDGGGDYTMNPNVMAYDWVNDQIVEATYDAAPVGGLGVRTGTSLRNNLQYSMGNRAAEELDQPVLLIAHPVNGSNIDSWLANGEGKTAAVNWNNLAPEVETALSYIGQDQIDAFLWHQGEGNFSMDQAIYEQKFFDLIDQVRGQDWADQETAFLVGELSREGDKFFQNMTLQGIEQTENDPNLEFVSSTGLSAYDDSGVHFSGTSLVEFGYDRFWDAYLRILAERADPGSTDTNNEAPVLAFDPADQGAPGTPPTALTVEEGEELRINVADYFTDPNGDQLYYYSYIDKRGLYLNDSDGEEIVIHPDFDHAGDYTLTIYASDYFLDGESFDIDLTVLDKDPLVTAYTRRDFQTEQDSYNGLETAMADLKANRAVELLSQDAISTTGPNEIILESFHISGDAGLYGDFSMGAGVTRSYFYGEADFNITGNDEDNYIILNDGDNIAETFDGRDRVYGGEGDDTIFGGAGNDKLYGDGGHDFLDAGTGSDQAYGGSGADVFYFENGDEKLIIRDFDFDGEGDKIQLAEFTDITNYQELIDASKIDYNETHDRTTLRFDDEQLILYDFEEDDLTEEMFVF